MPQKNLHEIVKKENWELRTIEGALYIEAFGKLFNPDSHPFSIYGKLYREEEDPELKYTFIKKMHDMLWPQDRLTWHSWTEDRFRAYCEPWRVISWASGASGGKSVDAAKLVIMEWYSSPKTTAAVIASTTLTSLNHRIFGYLLRYLKESAVKVPYIILRSQPPQILFDRDDQIHGISAMAAAKGGDQEAIKNYIGRHPKGRFVLALDEAPDLDPIILEALPNLEAGKSGDFKCLVIGNSASRNDLHGALSTPKDGWSSIDPKTTKRWETTQPGGLCQFFSCYESPAIHETDERKKQALSKFLITKEDLEKKEKEYGKDSEKFWRFVFGYWKPTGSESDLVMNEEFTKLFGLHKPAEFSGLRPLVMVGGLDAAFSTGGDNCILQLGVLGQDTAGNIVLDFRNEELTFYIDIEVNRRDIYGKLIPAEIQIANRVIGILNEYQCNLGNIAVDATGQGRALGELIRLQAQAIESPIKIWSTRVKNPKASEERDVIVKTSLELWTDVSDFVPTRQLRGIGKKAFFQFTNRIKDRTAKTQREVLENKLKYKQRMGAKSPELAHSPDEADAVALCLQAAKIKFGFHPGQVIKIQQSNDPSMREYLMLKAEKEREAKEAKKKPFSPSATFRSDFSVHRLGKI